MSASGEGHTAAAWALRLSLPSPVARDGIETAPWALVHRFARREQLAPLAWHRNGRLIRQFAPPPVLAAWRGDATAALSRSVRASALLGAVCDALEAAGAVPIVLKGLPLGERLYGTSEVRPSADLDVFVPAGARAPAHAALANAGWRHLSGDAPGEGIYATDEPRDARTILEVHSALTDDLLLDHLRPPSPGFEWRELDGRRVRAHDDAFLPAYLALQVAKHAAPSMLRLVDLASLWTALSGPERAQAFDVARRARLRRTLGWALDRAALLPLAAGGDRAALRALGVEADGRVRHGHNALRLASLADSVTDALRVAAAWGWPNADGRGRELVGRRLRRALRVAERRSTQAGATPALTEAAEPPDVVRAVDGAGLVEAVRTIVADAGGGLWIRAYGHSMSPAVPSGARVHLAPIDAAGVRRGDVVFAHAASGPLVHRVVASWRDRVVLHGDSMAWSDPVLERSQLLAAVDAVELATGVVPIGARPAPGRWRQLRRLPRQLGVLLGVVTAAPAGGRRLSTG